MNRARQLAVVMVALGGLVSASLTGCSDSTSAEDADYWTSLVQERWFDCFEGLKVRDLPTYEASKSSQREGFVSVALPNGGRLKFAVGYFQDGSPFTWPFDDATTNALVTVDCA